MLKRIFFLLLTYIIANGTLHAQTPTDIDSRVAAYLKVINYWGEMFKTPTDYDDSLIAANNRLFDYMKVVCYNPATLKASFPKAQEEGLITISSDDSILRFYSWDTWIDQTLHCFNSFMQYRTTKGIKVVVLNSLSNLYKHGDPGAYITDVTTVHTSSGKTVYLVTDCNIAGDNKGYEVKAYTMQQDTLVSIPFFKNGKNVLRSVDYAYRENYTGDTTGVNHGQFNTLHFSADKSKLFLPIIAINGEIDERYYIFKFDGEMYVYKKKGEDKEEHLAK